MNNKMLLKILFLTLASISAHAEETTPAAKPKTQKSDVLDFEGDVIEGQKKTLDLFLQLDVEKSDLSSVLYDRSNFNDFHVVDSKRRPKFSYPKRSAK